MKVFENSSINLFRWIYIFIMHIQGLGFKVWQIHRFTHWVGGKLCTIVVEFFTREFLQISTSFSINLFKWILYSTFGFQLSTSLVLFDSFLQVFTSPYINLFTCNFQHWCYLRTLHWFPSVVIVKWELLQALALTIDPKSITSSSSSTNFIFMKCNCFQPLCWVLLRASIVNCILYLLITFEFWFYYIFFSI